MAVQRSNFGDLLEPGFRKIYNDAFNEIPMKMGQILKENSSTKSKEEDSGVTGFGLLDHTGESQAIQYEDPHQMYDVTYVHQKYTKGFKISEELWEDDQYNVMNKKPAQLGRAARRTAEQSAANVLNRAFNTSYVGGDSKPLCSIIHPRSDGGSSQSNASSVGLTLTEENLETALLASRKQTDDKGMKISVMPTKLIVPIDLEKTANIIVGAEKRSGTADNDPNVYKGKLTPIAWDYLDSTTAWFLQDPTQSQLNWFWRIKPEFKQDSSFDNGEALFKVRTRFSNGWSDWRGFWGSKGDGNAYSS